MNRVLSPLLLLVALTACRSSGDFRMLYEPDPVPRDARSGRAYFRARIDSLSRRGARIGARGPTLGPGQSVWIDAELGAGESMLDVEIHDLGGRPVARLLEPVRTMPSKLEDEDLLPRPRLSGREPRVVAGFHASNHRMPGRRLALDLVPPEGIQTLGAEIASPVCGAVLGVTDDAPDVPGGRPNEVLLQCDDGSILLFSHLMRGSIPWRPGDRIEIGQTIGKIGLSGATTGPHLHLELVRGPRRRR